MAAGDKAAAAGLTIYTGNEPARELWVRDNEILDQVAEALTGVRPITRGGTGAITSAAALKNLGALPASDVVVSTSGVTVAGKVPRYDGSGRLVCGAPGALNHATPKAYVDNAIAGISTGWNGGTVTGQILVPNAYPATSGYSVAYINGDGRISRNASAERFKKFISDLDPLALGDLFPQLVRYQLRSQPDSPTDGAWHFGHIADRMAEDPDLERFVIYDTEDDGRTVKRDSFGRPVPLTIDFIALLLTQTANLNARAVAAEQRADALEARLEALERKISA